MSRRWIAGLAIICCAAACRAVPDAPSSIAYDREPCAHCRMVIGDPRFAVQLVTDAGDVLDFDDPGCALRYVSEHHPSVHRLWFRDHRSDRWTASSEVRFTRGAATPMGYGLAADPAGTLGLNEAAAAIAAGAPR